MIARPVAAVLLALCVSLSAQVVRQDPASRYQPVPFERILYLTGVGLRSEADANKVRELGFTSVMTGDLQQAQLAASAGLGVIADQIVGKGVLELRDAQWLAVQRAYSDGRDPATLVRPALLSDPATARALRDAAWQKLATFAPVEPWAASLGDEISVTRHRNPLDLCQAPATLERFRLALEKRHGSVDALNLAWGTTFPSFAHARPWTADEIRKREIGDGLPRNLRPWAEHREFMDEELARVVAELADAVHSKAPHLPLGLFGMQPPSAYGGHDLRRLLPWQQAFEVYDEGGALALARSFARPGSRQLLTITAVEGESPGARLLARVAACVSDGLGGTIVWSSERVLDQEGEATPFGRELGVAFRRLAPVFAVAGAREATSPIWIVESQASVRAWWMLDSASDGPTWIRRLSSYETSHSTSLAARAGWWKVLTDLGHQPCFVSEEDLGTRVGADGRSEPRLIVLPACIALSDAAVDAIAKRVANGAVVVADHEPALYDANLVLRSRGGLDVRFGVVRPTPDVAEGPREGRTLETLRLQSGAAAAEPGLLAIRALAERAAGTRLQIERRDANGAWCYLNLAVCEYPRVRLDPDRVDTARDLRRRVQRVLDLAKVAPEWPLRGSGLPTCLERAVLVGPSGERTLAVRVDALDAPAILIELSRVPKHEVEFLGVNEWQAQDLIGGGELRSGKILSFPLDVWTGLFLRLPGRK